MENKQENIVHLCRRCGRVLKSEESKALGMGPVCYEKVIKDNNCRKLFSMKSLQDK